MRSHQALPIPSFREDTSGVTSVTGPKIQPVVEITNLEEDHIPAALCKTPSQEEVEVDSNDPGEIDNKK